jgi:hypothetical protein
MQAIIESECLTCDQNTGVALNVITAYPME